MKRYRQARESGCDDLRDLLEQQELIRKRDREHVRNTEEWVATDHSRLQELAGSKQDVPSDSEQEPRRYPRRSRKKSIPEKLKRMKSLIGRRILIYVEKLNKDFGGFIVGVDEDWKDDNSSPILIAYPPQGDDLGWDYDFVKLTKAQQYARGYDQAILNRRGKIDEIKATLDEYADQASSGEWRDMPVIGGADDDESGKTTNRLATFNSLEDTFKAASVARQTIIRAVADTAAQNRWDSKYTIQWNQDDVETAYANLCSELKDRLWNDTEEHAMTVGEGITDMVGRRKTPNEKFYEPRSCRDIAKIDNVDIQQAWLDSIVKEDQQWALKDAYEVVTRQEAYSRGKTPIPSFRIC